MKFRVEPKIDHHRIGMAAEYWAIGYDVPTLKEVARASTEERAEEIARLLNHKAEQEWALGVGVGVGVAVPAPIPPVRTGKWWDIWK